METPFLLQEGNSAIFNIFISFSQPPCYGPRSDPHQPGLFHQLLSIALQGVVPGSAASASPGCLLEMQNLRPRIPGLLNQSLHFSPTPQWFLHPVDTGGPESGPSAVESKVPEVCCITANHSRDKKLEKEKHLYLESQQVRKILDPCPKEPFLKAWISNFFVHWEGGTRRRLRWGMAGGHRHLGIRRGPRRLQNFLVLAQVTVLRPIFNTTLLLVCMPFLSPQRLVLERNSYHPCFPVKL